MKIKEQTYFKITFITALVLFLAAIISFVALVINCFQGYESFKRNILEIVYMSFHIIVVVLVAAFAFKAIRSEESIILSTLMYNQYHRRSRPAKIISLIFSGIGFLLIIYEVLVFAKVNIPNFNFPLGLNLDIFNVALTILLMGLIFFFYPFVKGEKNN